MKSKKKYYPFRHDVFPLKAIGAALVLTISLLGFTAWHVWKSYQEYKAGPVQEYRYQFLLSTLNAGPDLTAFARQAAQTGDANTLTVYNRTESEVSNAIREIIEIAPDQQTMKVALALNEANSVLVSMERKAFELVAEGKPYQADQLLHSEKYGDNLEKFDSYNKILDETMRHKVETKVQELKRRSFYIFLAIIAASLVLLFVWFIVLRMVQRNLRERKKQEELNKTFLMLQKRLSEISSPKEAALIVMETADDLLGWDACFLTLYNREEDCFYSIINMDTVEGEKREVKFPDDEGEGTPYMRSIMKEGPDIISSIKTEEPSELSPFGNEKRRSRSLLFVPLMKGDRSVGVMSIQSYQPGRYDESDIRLLQILAGYCSGALDRAFVEESVQKELEKRVRERTSELTESNIRLKKEISERQKAEEKSRIQQEQLIQADKMVALGTLVSGVAHEINNPNHFILSNTTLLSGVWEDAIPVLNQYMDENGDFVLGGLNYSLARDRIPFIMQNITEGSQRIKRIVRELRDFSRSLPSDMNEDVDLNKVIRSSVMLLNNMIEKSTRKFSLHLDKNIPPAKGKFQRLEQVVINLLQNACQALSNPDCGIDVCTGYNEEAGNVFFRIKDQGKGIPEENLRRIMDPFFTTKRDSGGTGLGLSVSSKIINEHGGAMIFTSEPGKGTEVLVTLPVSIIKKGDEY